MIRIVGDIHGKVYDYSFLVKDIPYSIQLGDFGFKKTYEERDRMFEKYDIPSNNHFMIGGNHDDYDHLPNWSLGDFGYSNIHGFKFFFVRGARSIDKDRRYQGINYWEDEELNMQQATNAIDLYEKIKPDIVLSHDIPDDVSMSIFPNRVPIKSMTGQMMNTMFDIHQPKVWIFGHWHVTKKVDLDKTSFICLGELDHIDISSATTNIIDQLKNVSFDETS